MEVLRKLHVPAVEQVIAVPLISLDQVLQRSAIRRPQKAEQLVEVPTEPAYSLAVIAVQALGRRAAAALAEQIVYNPVPQVRRECGGGLQGLRAGQGSTMVDIPVPLGRREGGGGLQGFLPVQGPAADVDEGIQEVFSHFSPAQKSAKVTRQSSPRVPASVSSSKLSAHQLAPAGESDELVDEPGGALDPSLADLQRWRRGLRRQDGWS